MFMVAKRSAMRRAATAARRSFASAEAKVAAEANGAKSEPPPVSGSGLLLKSMLFVGGTGVGVYGLASTNPFGLGQKLIDSTPEGGFLRRALESVAPVDEEQLAADRAVAAELVRKAQAAASAKREAAEAAREHANELAAAESRAAAAIEQKAEGAADAEPSAEDLAALAVLFEAALAADVEEELVSAAVAESAAEEATAAAVAPEPTPEPGPTQAEAIDAALLRAERAAQDAHGDALAAKTRVEDEVEHALKDQLSQALATNIAHLEMKSRDELYLTAVNLINQQHQRSLAEAIMMHTLIGRQGKELRDLHELELEEALTAVRAESFNQLQDSLRRQERELEEHWREITTRERDALTAENAAATEEALRHTKERLDEQWAKAVIDANGALEARWQAERVERLGTVSDLTATVDAVVEYADRRSEYEELSHHAHRTTLALLAVRDCLDKGTPITAAIKTLEGVRLVDPAPKSPGSVAAAGGGVGTKAGAIDPIIDVALGAIPPTLLTGRRNTLATLPQLQARFADIVPTIEKASLTPANGGFAGKVLGAVTAGLLSKKTAETTTDRGAGLNVYGVCLAAQKQLAAGELAACLATLETLDGGCKDAASEWMFDARMRVAVEQMVTMVQAHLETQLASVY